MKRLIMGVAIVALTGFLAVPSYSRAEPNITIDMQIKQMLADKAPLETILWKYVDAGLDISDVINLMRKAGASDKDIVSTAVKEGFSAKQVVKAAINAGADPGVAMISASNAGASVDDVIQGARDSGIGTPEKILAEYKPLVDPNQGQGGPTIVAPLGFTPPDRLLTPPSDLFGTGGVGGAPASSESSPVI